MTTSRRNRNIAFAYFQAIGRIPKDESSSNWCLHHNDTTLKELDPDRYNEWRVEDLSPMTKSDHIRLHHKGKALPREVRNKLIGHAVSEETRRRISEASKRMWSNPEFRKRVHEKRSGRAPWNKGKHGCYSKETLQKMGKSRLGSTHDVSEDTRNKISAALKGKKFSEERRARLAIALRGRKMPPCSEEHRRKLSEAAKRRWARSRKEDD